MCFCAASTCACRVVATVVVVTRALLDQLSVGTSPASRLLVPVPVPREGALLRVLPVASSSCPYVQYEPIRPVGPAEVQPVRSPSAVPLVFQQEFSRRSVLEQSSVERSPAQRTRDKQECLVSPLACLR